MHVTIQPQINIQSRLTDTGRYPQNPFQNSYDSKTWNSSSLYLITDMLCSDLVFTDILWQSLNLGTALTNGNFIYEDIKITQNPGGACWHLV
jgi:hypothetical protein